MKDDKKKKKEIQKRKHKRAELEGRTSRPKGVMTSGDKVMKIKDAYYKKYGKTPSGSKSDAKMNIAESQDARIKREGPKATPTKRVETLRKLQDKRSTKFLHKEIASKAKEISKRKRYNSKGELIVKKPRGGDKPPKIKPKVTFSKAKKPKMKLKGKGKIGAIINLINKLRGK